MSASEIDPIRESVWIPTPRFTLEGELSYPEQHRPSGGAVIAGPHPLLGGSMDNNVVRNLAQGLAQLGLLVLRFNYRGVGRSEGPTVDVNRAFAEFWSTSHVREEGVYGEDLVAATEFTRQILGPLPLALIGYSFGGSLLPHAQATPEVPLILVAPTIGTHSYDSFATLSNPLLVIASRDDFAAGHGRLQDWFGQIRAPKELTEGQFDNHFFRGHEKRLTEAIGAFIDRQWSACSC